MYNAFNFGAYPTTTHGSTAGEEGAFLEHDLHIIAAGSLKWTPPRRLINIVARFTDTIKVIDRIRSFFRLYTHVLRFTSFESSDVVNIVIVIDVVYPITVQRVTDLQSDRDTILITLSSHVRRFKWWPYHDELYRTVPPTVSASIIFTDETERVAK